MRFRYRSSASRDAAAERRAAALTEAGVPVRGETDNRVAWRIIVDYPGVSICWTCKPRNGRLGYVVRDESGSVVMRGTPKGVATELRSRLPVELSPGSVQ